MSMTMSGSDIGRDGRASTLLFRCTPTAFTMLGGLVALVALIVQVSREQGLQQIYAFALVAATAGVGFALDDSAAEIVAASPTTLGRRRIVRVAVAGTIVVIGWVVIAIVVAATQGSDQFPTYDITIELAALVAIGLATSATIRRRTSGPGGPTAALVVLVGPVFWSGIAFGDVGVFPSLVPGQDLRERWVWLALLAAAALLLASRDPAARSRLHRSAGGHTSVRRRSSSVG